MIDVSCAIIIKDYKILAAQRSPTGKLPLKWEFPGGKVEKNESIRESLIREIKEELNIEIEINEALTPVEYAYSDFSIRLHPFVCQFIGGVMEKREHHQILWLEYSELWDLDWAEADKPIVKELMELEI